MTRPDWRCLNGEWRFAADPGGSGFDRDLQKAGDEAFPQKILVPFCPESPLSGVGVKDFMAAVWYRRAIRLSAEDLSGRVLLHFGAADYVTHVYVNEKPAGTHRGGYASFTLDITPYVQEGENALTVACEDDPRSLRQPSGKQSKVYYSHDCDYTRTTGIWQSVWLEFVPVTYIQGYRVVPDPENGKAYVTVRIAGADLAAAEFPGGGAGGGNKGDGGNKSDGLKVTASVSFKGAPVCEASACASGGAAYLCLDIPNPALWGPGVPNLYDISLSCGVDRVEGYFGMRSVSLSPNAILINGKPVFQRLVLDQGFNPEGVYTAPSDDFLRRDIELSMAAGFNGARLHQRVFEERFLYWADKLGYLVWGEHASWGLDISGQDGYFNFAPEWREIVERDFNHPAIVGWCPFNETGVTQNDDILRGMYELTKSLDPTRPVIDTSGYVHVKTDVFDVHDYEQDPAAFAAHYAPMATEPGYVYNPHAIHTDAAYGATPYFVSEYGGTWWNEEEARKAAAQGNDRLAGWGYGNRPRTAEEAVERIGALTAALLQNPRVCAFCYTQLTDVEQEQNGIYTYAREAKFDAARLRAIFGGPAAIEKP